MYFFQATKLAFELTMLYSQTQCELWLEKNKVVFLSSSETIFQNGKSHFRC